MSVASTFCFLLSTNIDICSTRILGRTRKMRAVSDKPLGFPNISIYEVSAMKTRINP